MYECMHEKMYSTFVIHLCTKMFAELYGLVWSNKQQGQDGNSKGCIGKADHFWKDLVCLTVYVFYRRKLAHTLHMLVSELKGQ